MNDKNILVIPHTPHTHVKVRSLEIAKAFAEMNKVYYLLWDEVSDFSLLSRLKQRMIHLTSGSGVQAFDQRYDVRRFSNVTVLENVPRAYSPIWYADRHNSGQIDCIIDEYGIDVVINAALISSPVRKKASLTYIYDLVDDPFSSGKSRTDRIRKRFIDKELSRADIVSACSLTLAEYASETWGREVLYLPNGTDVSSFRSVSEERVAALKRKWGIEGKKIIGFISNFEPWNGLPFLAGVFKKLSDRRNDVVLLLVGSGKGLNQVRHEYESMRNVVMTGAVPPEEIASYFRIADVGVLPFDQCDLTDRALPIKILEYGAGRKHVVAVPLTELRRQNFPNVHLVEKEIGLWVEAIDSAIAADWDVEWDNIYCGYDWKEIVQDRLVPRIESVVGMFKDGRAKLIREPNGILSHFSRI